MRQILVINYWYSYIKSKSRLIKYFQFLCAITQITTAVFHEYHRASNCQINCLFNSLKTNKEKNESFVLMAQGNSGFPLQSTTNALAQGTSGFPLQSTTNALVQGTSGFPLQSTTNVESISMSWSRHDHIIWLWPWPQLIKACLAVCVTKHNWTLAVKLESGLQTSA